MPEEVRKPFKPSGIQRLAVLSAEVLRTGVSAKIPEDLVRQIEEDYKRDVAPRIRDLKEAQRKATEEVDKMWLK